jgi:hypothetical protein
MCGCDVSPSAQLWKDYAWLCINARIGNALISAMSGVSRGLSHGRRGLRHVPDAIKAARM